MCIQFFFTPIFRIPLRKLKKKHAHVWIFNFLYVILRSEYIKKINTSSQSHLNISIQFYGSWNICMYTCPNMYPEYFLWGSVYSAVLSLWTSFVRRNIYFLLLFPFFRFVNPTNCWRRKHRTQPHYKKYLVWLST